MHPAVGESGYHRALCPIKLPTQPAKPMVFREATITWPVPLNRFTIPSPLVMELTNPLKNPRCAVEAVML